MSADSAGHSCRRRGIALSAVEYDTIFKYSQGNGAVRHCRRPSQSVVSLARSAKRCVLDNSNDPQLPTLSIPDKAAMDAFLDEMLVIYPVLGLTAFEVSSHTPKVTPDKVAPDSTMLRLSAREGKIKASGYDKGEGFVVLAGSDAVGDKDITATFAARPGLVSLRKSLVDRGVLVAAGDHFKFTQDYTFNSPSQAASVPIGHCVSGPDNWKDDQGRTLKAIQQAAIGGSAWQKAGLVSEGT